MATRAEPIAERNPFLTGRDLAPVTTLSEKLGLSPGARHDEANDHDGEELSEGSASDDGSEEDRGIDEVTLEEMARLEGIFKEKGMKFRMVDRIGEGDLSSACCPRATWLRCRSRHFLYCIQG